MKAFSLFCLLAILPSYLFSQTLVWQRPASPQSNELHPDGKGNLYVNSVFNLNDLYSDTLSKLDSAGSVLWARALDTMGVGPMRFSGTGLYGIAYEAGAYAVMYINDAGERTWSRSLAGYMPQDHGLATDHDGNLYLLDQTMTSEHLLKLDRDGKTLFDLELPHPKIKDKEYSYYIGILVDNLSRAWAVCFSTSYSEKTTSKGTRTDAMTYLDLTLVNPDGSIQMTTTLWGGASYTLPDGTTFSSTTYGEGNLMLASFYQGRFLIGTTDAYTGYHNGTYTWGSQWLFELVSDKGEISTFNYPKMVKGQSKPVENNHQDNFLSDIVASDEGVFMLGQVSDGVSGAHCEVVGFNPATAKKVSMLRARHTRPRRPLKSSLMKDGWSVRVRGEAVNGFIQGLLRPGSLALDGVYGYLGNHFDTVQVLSTVDGAPLSTLVFPFPVARNEWEPAGAVDGNYVYGDLGWDGGPLYKYELPVIGSRSVPGSRLPEQGSKPSEFALDQNFPNPFNPVTQISYALPVDGHVTLTVYNTLGQVVRTLVDGYQTAGYRTITFDGTNLSSGLYFYRIETSGFSRVRKLLLTK